jgi:hypothetical protein
VHNSGTIFKEKNIMPTTYKVLGQAAPANTSSAVLYTVPADTQTIVSTLVISNLTATEVNANVNICVLGVSSTNANTILKALPIPSNSLVTFTLGITMSATDVIRIQSAQADALSFNAFGSEITA